MPTVIGRTPSSNLPSDQLREIQLAWTAFSDLAPDFTWELRESLILDLLGRLSAEKARRAAKNLNHWEAYAERRVPALAKKILAERDKKVAAHLKEVWDRWNELAWRVTRSAALVDLTLARTAWELWTGQTREDVSSRAVVMNARNLLRDRSREQRRSESLESLLAASSAHGEALDFPSHRPDDKDPLDILIAREEQRETDDELTYAIDNVHCQGNKGIRRADWWKESALSELERQVRRTKNRGSGE